MPALATVRRRSPWVIGALLVVAALVVFGVRSCSGKVVDAGGVMVLVAGYQSGGMDASGGGTLEVVGGCLGARGSVFVFPKGTDVVDEDPLTIEIPGVGEVALGEEFEVGGGWVVEGPDDLPDSGPLELAGVTVPSECTEYDIFLSAPQ